MKILIGLVTFFFSMSVVFGQETSDVFNVSAYDDHFKVVAPSKWKSGTSMILRNHTLSTIYAEIRTGDEQKQIATLSVRPNEFYAVDLKLKNNENAVLIPLSPPFQEVILEFGKKSYEIPAKR